MVARRDGNNEELFCLPFGLHVRILYSKYGTHNIRKSGPLSRLSPSNSTQLNFQLELWVNDNGLTISESSVKYFLSNFPCGISPSTVHPRKIVSGRCLFQFFASRSLHHVESASEKGTLGMQQSCEATSLKLHLLYVVKARADRGSEAGASGGLRTIRQWQNWINRYAWT